MTYEELKELLDSAETENKRGDFFKSEKLCDEVISLLLSTKEDDLTLENNLSIIIQSRALRIKSESLYNRAMAKEALNSAEEALSLARYGNNQKEEASALNSLGNINIHLSKHEEAIKYFKNSISLYEILGNQLGVANTTGNIGMVYCNLNDYESALEYFEQSLVLQEKLGNKLGTANALNNIGSVLIQLSQYETALEHFKRSLALYEEIDNRIGVANASGNIGMVYCNISDYELALEYFKKSLSLQDELGNLLGAGNALNNIGNVLVHLSQYEGSLLHFMKALSIYEKIGHKIGIANLVSNIGIVYFNLHEYNQALEYFQRSIPLHEEIGNQLGVANAIINIANAYNTQSQFEIALEYFEKSLEIYEQIGHKIGVANIFGDSGHVFFNQKKYNHAIDYFKKSLELQNELGNRLGAANATYNIGIVLAQDDFVDRDEDKAEESLLKAISEFQVIGAKKEQYDVCNTLAKLYKHQERWKESLEFYEKYHALEKEIQSEEAKKLADKLAYERREAEREKQLATERARLEEREKIIDELTELNSSLHEANRQKNEVLGIVAHDLKNPLAAILLSSGTLTRYLPNLNQDEILDQLGRIKSTAERMNQIILNLLDIQKLEAGKLTLELKPLEISSILRTMSKNFQVQAQVKNIEIHTEIPKLLTALSENSAFQEVLENLISNAIKFSPFDKNIFVRAESNDQTVRISIQDEGPGLTEEDKQNLFGQFTRLSAQPTGGEHSSGLGLSIVKRLVEMMNGKMFCESEVGKGAKFIVELPKAE